MKKEREAKKVLNYIQFKYLKAFSSCCSCVHVEKWKKIKSTEKKGEEKAPKGSAGMKLLHQQLPLFNIMLYSKTETAPRWVV